MAEGQPPKVDVGPQYVAQADVTSNCLIQSFIAGIGGLGFGALIGLAFGGAEGIEQGAAHKQSARSYTRAFAREAGSRAWAYAKGFGSFGAVYRQGALHSFACDWPSIR